MKRKVSEFSYGFVLTHELVHACGYLTAETATFTAGRKPARFGSPLFLQFRASDYMKRRNAGESKLVGLPYFRFVLYRRTQSNLHQLLTELEKKGNAVFYATPKIHEAVNLNSAFFDRKVVANSLFVSPCEIGELQDNESHRVVFSGRTTEVYLCPEQRRLDGAVHGEDFQQAIIDRTADFEPRELNDEFFYDLASIMVSLISPNRRIFDELTRGRSEMPASVFASYLARTLFDCELLVAPVAE